MKRFWIGLCAAAILTLAFVEESQAGLLRKRGHRGGGSCCSSGRCCR